MKRTFLSLAVILMISCGESAPEQTTTPSADDQEAMMEEENEDEEDTPKVFELGLITFEAGDIAFEINEFGIDPYCVMTKYTSNSDVAPMLAAVFKSADFNKAISMSIVNIPSPDEDFSGELEVGKGINMGVLTDSYNFSVTEGSATVEAFNTTTGKVKLSLNGSGALIRTSGENAGITENIPVTMSIDAVLTNAVVDGTQSPTFAAEKHGSSLMNN